MIAADWGDLVIHNGDGNSTFFRPELFEFLRQLRGHNNREWFAKNKERHPPVILEIFLGRS